MLTLRARWYSRWRGNTLTDTSSDKLAEHPRAPVCYYTFENFMDAATQRLQAVEAALRVRLGVGPKASFGMLIKRAQVSTWSMSKHAKSSTQRYCVQRGVIRAHLRYKCAVRSLS